MENPLDFEEERIPFYIEIKGNFYYKYRYGKYDADSVKREIYEVLSDAIDSFEAFDGDIELQDIEYTIET